MAWKRLKRSIYGCFLKWWYPPNTPTWSCLVLKPKAVGYHHFRTSPYISWKLPYSSEPPEFHDQSGQLFDFLRVIQCHWAKWRTESWLFNDFHALLDVLCKFKEGETARNRFGEGKDQHLRKGRISICPKPCSWAWGVPCRQPHSSLQFVWFRFFTFNWRASSTGHLLDELKGY